MRSPYAIPFGDHPVPQVWRCRTCGRELTLDTRAGRLDVSRPGSDPRCTDRLWPVPEPTTPADIAGMPGPRQLLRLITSET